MLEAVRHAPRTNASFFGGVFEKERPTLGVAVSGDSGAPSGVPPLPCVENNGAVSCCDSRVGCQEHSEAKVALEIFPRGLVDNLP